MEDALQSIFGYLDKDSLKQCRLVCSFWNPTATRFLMKRTFCELQSLQSDTGSEFNLMTSFTSVKINEDVLAQLSVKAVPLSFSSSWRSISVSVVPSESGMQNLTKFLGLISFGRCPYLKHMKIHFAEVPKLKQEIGRLNQKIECEVSKEQFLEGNECRNIATHSISQPPHVDLVSSVYPIQSLHLIFDASINTLPVSDFLPVFLKKNVVPNLKELVAEFPDSKAKITTSDEHPHFSRAYKKIMETFEEFGDILRSLRLFKAHSNVPCGVPTCWSPLVEYFAYHGKLSELPGPRINLEFTSALKELRLGSGVVGNICGTDPPLFFPCVLTPSVACVLKSLDLSGIYIIERTPIRFPPVTFPHMPCLKKLTVELVAFKWIDNFQTIFEAAQTIRDLRLKNSWAGSKAHPFIEVRHIINFEEWENTWGPGGYQALIRLELGDSVDVKNSATLQKINGMFPNIKELQFTCDDKLRRIPHETHKVCCDMEVMVLKGIVEGLKGWKSLTHLNVTYWPIYTVSELLDHFQDCTAKLPSLRLYDFKWINGTNSNVSMVEQCTGYIFVQMKEKLLKLKVSPQVVFVLHSFKCPHEHLVDGVIQRLHKYSMMDAIFRFAEKEAIFNFRRGTVQKVPLLF